MEGNEECGDDAIRLLTDAGLSNTTVTVVSVGNKTAVREFISYEIERSLKTGNGLVGLPIHHLKDQDENIDSPGETPAELKELAIEVYSTLTRTHLSARSKEQPKELATGKSAQRGGHICLTSE